MNQRVVILPMDGYADTSLLLGAFDKILDAPGIGDLLAFVKLNDAVHNYGMGGPHIMQDIYTILRERKLPAGIFLDLKIFDVSATLENTLKKYAATPPNILTVSSACSADGIVKLRKLLPNTKLAMISTLTDIGLKECLSRFGQPPAVKIYNDLVNMERVYQELVSGLDINQKPFDAVICSPLELDFLRKNLPRTIDLIVPGIRDEWMLKANEHQKRTTGVKWALDHGANYVVMGAQMTKGNPELAVSAEESRIRTFEEIKKAAPNLIVEGDPLATLRNCKGFYESRKNQADQYLGPLVTYAKKYQDAEKKDKNMVGFIYLNFAKAERYWKVRDWFAGLIDAALAPISENLRIDVVLGAPLGGMLFAGDVGRHLNCQTIFAEKIVTKAADKEKNEREISHLSLERHEINAGDRVAIVEDVTNNFSTTEEANALIENYGGKLVAIICPFNRSGKSDWNGIPVISACNTPLNQYRQDDPMVSELVDEGNIVMKPKLEWEKLEAAMEEKQIE